MIGNFGRTAFGGRVGGKRNRKLNPISPKGGGIKNAPTMGSMNKFYSIGSNTTMKPVGGIKNPKTQGISIIPKKNGGVSNT